MMSVIRLAGLEYMTVMECAIEKVAPDYITRL